MIITVLNRQTWFDIAIQYTGIVYNALDIAWANGRALSERLEGGQELLIPQTLPTDPKVLQYYQAREIIPATGQTDYTKDQNETEMFELPGELPMSL